MVRGLRLFQLSVREAARGSSISLDASSRNSPRYIEALDFSPDLLVRYAEEHDWPDVSDITTSHIEEYLAYLKSRPRWFGVRGDNRIPSQSHVETQYRRIKRFFNWLLERGHVESNPVDLIPHPRIDERVIATVNERQATKLLKYRDRRLAKTRRAMFFHVRDRAALLLLFDTPGRRTEIGNLRVDDVDLDDGSIKVLGKGGKERWMPFGSACTEALWDYLRLRREHTVAGIRNLWVDYFGRTISPNWLYRMLKRLSAEAGVSDLHTHRFRHTFAMAALRSGMPEQILRILGGWRTIPATYFRTLDQEDAKRFHREMSPADKLVRHPSRKSIGHSDPYP